MTSHPLPLDMVPGFGEYGGRAPLGKPTDHWHDILIAAEDAWFKEMDQYMLDNHKIKYGELLQHYVDINTRRNKLGLVKVPI